jgi:invasion protein IalB
LQATEIDDLPGIAFKVVDHVLVVGVHQGAGRQHVVPKLVVRTPNGVLLSAGVGLGFGNAKPSSLPFYTCGPKACIAETPLTDDWISALSADAELKITFSMVNAKPVSQGIPLKGFADGFKYFSEQIVAAQ